MSTLVRGWQWEPLVVVPLSAVVAAYAIGGRRYARRRRATASSWRSVAFVAGSAVFAIALLSPLDEVSSSLFTAHMVQHELLMAIAAPLLVLARPGVPLLWAVPLRARRQVGGLLSAPTTRATWQRLTRPADAWLLHAVAIWLWHVPSLFQLALRNDVVHFVQHVSFFGSGLLYWWAVLHPRRRDALGLSILSLFGTAVHTAALGALLATSRAVWYPAYGARAATWGLTPLEDQQLAGLVMWIPVGFVYLAVALWTFRRWMQRPDWHFENPQQLRSTP